MKNVFLEVRLPKTSEETPESMTSFFSSLLSVRYFSWWKRPFFKILRMPNFSFEMLVENSLIHFYVVIPENYQNFFESQLAATYPRILFNRCPDPLEAFADQKYIALGRLLLGSYSYYPLKTYKDFRETDPLSSFLGALGKAKQTEKALFQIVIQPADPAWQTRARSQISQGVVDPINPQRRKPLPFARVIEEKISQGGFRVASRIIAASSSKEESLALMRNVAGGLGVFNRGDGNFFILKRPWPWQKKRFFRSIAQRRPRYVGHFHVLNVLELASIFHFPGKPLANIKNIAWGQSFLGEPPETLPVAQGLEEADKKQINFIAKTTFRNRIVSFGIKKQDRRRHVYVIGKTGTGKSTLIANMAINDMRNGEGVAVIDPHGDLSEILLDYVPSFRLNDVCYLDPKDTAHPFALNTLEVKDPSGKDLIASGIVSIFNKIYHYSWGPRLEYILRNSILTLLEVPESTLVLVPKLLSDKEYRDRILPKINDPILRDFWLKEFDQMHPRLKSEAISPILNKVGQFVSSPMIRALIGFPHSTIDFEEFMNKGKILIVNLAQGKIGEDAASLLGAMFISKIQLAAMSRVTQKEEERKDFYLYVDEFQNFATTSFVKILSEARKYHLCLTLANQYIGQLDEGLEKAIFGNVGTLVSFIIGAGDARSLSREFGQVYKEEDLVVLGKYQIISKLAIDDLTSLPFPGWTMPLPRCKNQNREKVIRLSRERYTRTVTLPTETPQPKK